MVVIKLGGSLLSSGGLVDCLNALERDFQGRAVVIVPGGGQFADQVRAAQDVFQFDDVTAHAMAVLAMQQTALLIKGLKPDFVLAQSVDEIKIQSALKKIMLWSPELDELNAAGIAASWDITSDSLAAWLASRLVADELILVKSASVDAGLDIKQLAEQDIVDRSFTHFIKETGFTLKVVSKGQFTAV